MKVKTRLRKASDTLTSFLSQLLHGQLHRKLVLFLNICIYHSTSVFPYCHHSRVLSFSLFLQLPYLIQICLIPSTYASFCFTVSFPFSAIIYLLKYDILMLQQKGRSKKVEGVSAYASIKVHPYLKYSIYLFLASPLCSIAQLSRCLRMTLFYSVFLYFFLVGI